MLRALSDRLFGSSTRTITPNHARETVIKLRVEGMDGFTLDGASSVAEISRSFEELLSATFGSHHQYPDGFVLFTGTMFTPSKDRVTKGRGFTHQEGDVVTISADKLGALTNQVVRTQDTDRWEFGIAEFITNLSKRQLP